MADNLTAEQRKKNMQNIKSKDTKIELSLRKALSKKLQGIARKTGYCPDKVSYCNFL